MSVLITFILTLKFHFIVFPFFQLYADNFHIDEHEENNTIERFFSGRPRENKSSGVCNQKTI